MKTYRTSSGPFPERPFYELDDVEQICNDELRKVGLFPSEPGAIRIERFIEKKFKISPKYEGLPDDILGYTEFGPKGVQEIFVSRSLVERKDRVSERRVITTLAHEAGHGLLHAHLFALGHPPKSLFGDHIDCKELKILCRKDSVEGVSGNSQIKYGGRWWEYQANLAIGGLLLPRQLVKKVLEPFLIERERLGNMVLNPDRREEATRELVEVFDVNPIVARIRISLIFPLSQESQLSL